MDAGGGWRANRWLQVLLLLLGGAVAVCGGGRAEAAVGVVQVEQQEEDPCPLYEYVYWYWSVCNRPARHYENFQLVNIVGNRGGLQITGGGGDYETWVSFTGESDDWGTSFYAMPLAKDPLLGIPVNTDVVLVNSETGRPLTWTFQVLTSGFVLTEADPDATTNQLAIFRFVRADSIPLACPRIANARCEAYYLLSNAANATGSSELLSGLLPYNRLGIDLTFIIPADSGSLGSLPFVLRDPSWSSTSAVSKLNGHAGGVATPKAFEACYVTMEHLSLSHYVTTRSSLLLSVALCSNARLCLSLPRYHHISHTRVIHVLKTLSFQFFPPCASSAN